MGVINVLDFTVANLIAAGEVVDRPASVIKELMENSIDAGATAITVEIKRGGISFMRVSDNGKGIDKDDLPIAIKRHATSKIRESTDLDSIMTLGFRGEALAAIASVSKMRIISKTVGAAMGHIMESECGEVKQLTEAGCADGTTVIVEDLFANVPARLKFLKKDNTEAMAVSTYVEKIALSRPDISIKLIIDGAIKFMTSGDGKLYDVIYVLLGRDFANRTIAIDNRSEGIHIYGFISTPDNIRANRNFQNFFINKRFIKSKTIAAALEQAYSTFIPSDRFPCGILNIEINPAYVDVNVHPAKLEVKFSNERLIFESVYASVRQALENRITRPEFDLSVDVKYTPETYKSKLNPFVPISDGKRDIKEQISFTPSEYKRHEPKLEERKPFIPSVAEPFYPTPASNHVAIKTFEPSAPAPSYEVRTVTPNENFTVNTFGDNKDVPLPPPEPVFNNSEVTVEEAKPIIPEFRIIGEAFNSYVFVETDESVLIIDKHAAHERIIFEELKRNMKKQRVISQLLLVPLDIKLSDTEIAAISEYKNEIKATGFDFRILGNILSITEMPVELDADTAVPLIQTIADRISDGTGNISVSRAIVYEKALFQASCKAAVKIGHIHDPAHIKWICEKVLSLDIIKFCPHGRPVAFELTKRDFEKQFKRI